MYTTDLTYANLNMIMSGIHRSVVCSCHTLLTTDTLLVSVCVCAREYTDDVEAPLALKSGCEREREGCVCVVSVNKGLF